VKYYTGRGDAGITSLAKGERISKSSVRVEAYGDVDELNSIVGLARTRIRHKDVFDVLKKIQSDLFTVGAELATTDTEAEKKIGRYVEKEMLTYVEEQINVFSRELLIEGRFRFVLPGGCEEAAGLYLARAMARRAERHIVELSQSDHVGEILIAYMNRLSSILYVLARVMNRRMGGEEDEWPYY
jgi:cob(I)alamin adenosyltransferase